MRSKLQDSLANPVIAAHFAGFARAGAAIVGIIFDIIPVVFLQFAQQFGP